MSWNSEAVLARLMRLLATNFRTPLLPKHQFAVSFLFNICLQLEFNLFFSLKMMT